MNNTFNLYETEDYFYLTGLYLMLISQWLTVYANIKFIGAAICLVYVLLYPKNNNDRRYLCWVFSFTAFFLMSVLWSLKEKVALYVFVYHLIPYFIFTVATMKYLNSYRKLFNILTAVFVCGIVLLVYLSMNIDEFILGVRLGSSLNDEDTEERFWNVNVIGMCLCFSLYAGWIVFNKIKKGLIIKVLFISVLVLFIFASLLTGSRKVLLMLAIPIGYFLYKKTQDNLILGLAGLITVFIAGYFIIMNVEFLYSTIGSRAEDMMVILMGEETGYEDDSRVYLAKYGIEWWKENPIWGVGINCYKVLSNETSMFRGKMFYAHNNYIELLVDVGVVGTFLYYRGYYYLLRESLKEKSEAMSWVFIMIVVVLFLDTGNVSYYDMRVQFLLVVLFVVLRLENNKVLLEEDEDS